MTQSREKELFANMFNKWFGENKHSNRQTQVMKIRIGIINKHTVVFYNQTSLKYNKIIK